MNKKIFIVLVLFSNLIVSTLCNVAKVDDIELSPTEKLIVDQILLLRKVEQIVKNEELSEVQKQQKIQEILPINNGGGGFASGLITGENLGGGLLSGVLSGVLAGLFGTGGGYLANPNWTGAYIGNYYGTVSSGGQWRGTAGYLGPSTGNQGPFNPNPFTGPYFSGSYYSGAGVTNNVGLPGGGAIPR